MMIQIELSQDIERRLYEQAHVQGVEVQSYVTMLIENAIRNTPSSLPKPKPDWNMDAFFKAMTADSHKLPQLPEEAFTRESFYQDHD